MRPIDILTVTFKNLFRQKGRSLLTIAQMVVGVFLISMMLSIGNGLKDFMISQVTLFADKKTISVYKSALGTVEKGVLSLGFGHAVEEFEGDEDIDKESDVVFSRGDLEQIQRIPHVSEAVFQTIIIADYIRLDNSDSKKLKVSLDCMPRLLRERLRFTAVNRDELSRGDGIILPEGYADAWGISKEELLEKDVWVRVTQTGGELQELFEIRNAPPIQSEKKEFKFQIVGFAEKNVFSQMAFISPTMGDVVSAYITDQSLASFKSNSDFMEILLIVDEESNVPIVDEELEIRGYNTMTYDESVGQIGVIFDIISIALSAFGLIAVGVSSIGVANTLLMAVYERTQEIGVMKAVGASSKVIHTLFIVEAAWLGMLGGTLGLSLSYLISNLANRFLHKGITLQGEVIVEGFLLNYPALDISQYPVWMFVVVMLLIIVVSVLAGLSPARKASKLDTIVALKKD